MLLAHQAHPQFAAAPRAGAGTYPIGERIGGQQSAAALFGGLAEHGAEQARFAYLDPEWRLLLLREVDSPHAERVDIPVRLIAADALAWGAASVVMAHNHPSGDARPSAQDIATTRSIARALALIEVRLIDHLVFARGGGTTSLRSLGLL